MPNRYQHKEASKKLLGYYHPIVHDLLDKSFPQFHEHRRTHNPQFIEKIGEWFGQDCETEAWLHFFMDYGLVKLEVNY